MSFFMCCRERNDFFQLYFRLLVFSSFLVEYVRKLTEYPPTEEKKINVAGKRVKKAAISMYFELAVSIPEET